VGSDWGSSGNGAVVVFLTKAESTRLLRASAVRGNQAIPILETAESSAVAGAAMEGAASVRSLAVLQPDAMLQASATAIPARARLEEERAAFDMEHLFRGGAQIGQVRLDKGTAHRPIEERVCGNCFALNHFADPAGLGAEEDSNGA
jgi:hypothetical protein